jgi:hypothetical protein
MNHSERFGFRTEIEFSLPKGYVDAAGNLHRKGVMRLATAADEILPLRDPRVQQNEAYLTVIVLARVIVKLGTLTDIDTGVIEGLYASDLSFLQRLYETLNAVEDDEAANPPVQAGSSVRPSLNGMTALGEA